MKSAVLIALSAMLVGCDVSDAASYDTAGSATPYESDTPVPAGVFSEDWLDIYKPGTDQLWYRIEMASLDVNEADAPIQHIMVETLAPRSGRAWRTFYEVECAANRILPVRVVAYYEDGEQALLETGGHVYGEPGTMAESLLSKVCGIAPPAPRTP